MLEYITHLLIHFWTYRPASGDSILVATKAQSTVHQHYTSFTICFQSMMNLHNEEHGKE